jgi:hypothetical protein
MNVDKDSSEIRWSVDEPPQKEITVKWKDVLHFASKLTPAELELPVVMRLEGTPDEIANFQYGLRIERKPERFYNQPIVVIQAPT